MATSTRCCCLQYSKIYVKHLLTRHTRILAFYQNQHRNLRGTRLSIARENLSSEERKYEDLLKKFRQNGLPSPTQVYEESEGASSKESTKTEIKTPFERLNDKMTPFMRLPYNQQLHKKYTKSLGHLKVLGQRLQSLNVPIAIGKDGLPCPMSFVTPSPQIETYRNKDEFSIRPGIDGNPKTVGFFLESPSENPDIQCIAPNEVPIIKASHKAFAKDFENYIRQSPLQVCIRFEDGGHWRNVVVRSNLNEDLMGIIIMHPQNLTKIELEHEKDKIKDYFLALSKSYNLKSLYFQTCPKTKCTHEESPFELLHGEPHIVEEMNGLKFVISPESFFQTNTRAAECMYTSLLKLCKVNQSTTVLDICCGTGPISLTFANHVRKCIGIDSSTQSIMDARQNAHLNNVQNVEFFQGRCEDKLLEVIKSDFHDELIAIVNPPASGLGKYVIQSLRECRYLKKVVYLSCKPEQAMENFAQLCRPPGSMQKLGKPFLPIMAVPVDLFPHTKHCELMILFQRI